MMAQTRVNIADDIDDVVQPKEQEMAQDNYNECFNPAALNQD